MPGRLEFNLGFGAKPAAQRRSDSTPMRLLVLGDFSGRPAGERPALAERRTQRIDIDNVDAVLQKLQPRLRLAAGDLPFTSLDDFHPDALDQRSALFAALREARSKPPAAGADLLAGLLGGSHASPGARGVQTTPATGIDAFIRHIVAPHTVPDTRLQDDSYRAAVDAATAEQMRTLLHDPAFQALESAWRGVQWLVSSLELDERLELHLLDVSRDELLADIMGVQGQLAQTGLHRALADRWRGEPGAAPWSLLAGLYSFGPSDADIGLLAALGLIAAQAGGPFVAAAAPELAVPTTTPGVLAGWQRLRSSEAAPWLGLASPRVLLRLPYGKGGEPIEAFAFEEFPGGVPVHGHLLWGPSSLAVALLVGRAFTARGWDFEPGDEREIGDLPAYSFMEDGERVLQTGAEQQLDEQGGKALLAEGLMPVMGHRDRNAVTVLRLQSIADPAQPLAGLRQ